MSKQAPAGNSIGCGNEHTQVELGRMNAPGNGCSGGFSIHSLGPRQLLQARHGETKGAGEKPLVSQQMETPIS